MTTRRFLALGDSYTIGESVAQSESWPNQLTSMLQAGGITIQAPHIIAQTGWRTSDLLDALEIHNLQGWYDLVSLLIGVNNQYENGDIATYREEFGHLLGMAIKYANGYPSKVLVLSIPDWSVTPFADGRDRAQIRAQINAFNLENKQESQNAGVNYIDITPISRQVHDDPSLLASDGLHPSHKMYARWVNLVQPAAIRILQPI